MSDDFGRRGQKFDYSCGVGKVRFLGGFLRPTFPPSLTNPRLVTALAHPTRMRALCVLDERPATPREVAELIGEPVNNVAYHFKVLRRLNCVTLVETRQAAGGRVTEHVYRSTERYKVWDTTAWEQLSAGEKLDASAAIMQKIAEDVAESMASGTLYEDDDRHVSRMPMSLDQDGWEEVATLLADTLGELFAIQARVDERTGGPEERPHHARVNILHFRSPPPKTL